MTATVDQQIRSFHMTGQGLEAQQLELTLEGIAAGRSLPKEEDVYPIRHGAQLQIPFEAEAAVTLPTVALLDARRNRRAQFIEHIRQSAERLEDLLALDDSHSEDAISAGSIRSALGLGGSLFLNAASLASALRRRVSPVHRMEPRRRERCRMSLAVLRQALQVAVEEPPMRIFYQGVAPANPLGCELCEAADPCAAGLAFVKRQLAEAERVLQARRVAKLELDSAYVEEVHDSILERFRWEVADSFELEYLSPVLIVLSAAQAGQLPMDSLSHVLRSGCPIQVVITKPSLTVEELNEEATDFAAIGIAQRCAIVAQTSLAFPDHLMAELEAAAVSMRPSLIVLATPCGGGWNEAAMLVLSRAWALYAYHPNRGSTMRECLRLRAVEPNLWSIAEAAAMNPLLKSHFRQLPESEVLQEALEIGAYLEQFQRRAPLAVPFFVVHKEDGTEMRVAVSRDLAEYCHQRQEAWKMLEDLSTLPVVIAASAPVVEVSRDAAMREGAEMAIARVVELLSSRKQ
jgi:hypothetical protein